MISSATGNEEPTRPQAAVPHFVAERRLNLAGLSRAGSVKVSMPRRVATVEGFSRRYATASQFVGVPGVETPG